MEKEQEADLESLGCPREIICGLKETRDKEVKLLLLTSYRKVLLEKVHDAQKKLENLDYILYQIKKEKEQ